MISPGISAVLAQGGHIPAQRAMWFSGDDYINISNNKTGILVSPYFFFSANIYDGRASNDLGLYRIIYNQRVTPNGWALSINGGKLFYRAMGGSISFSISLNSTEWNVGNYQKIGVASTSTSSRLYLDGDLNAFGAPVPVSYSNNYGCYLGGDPTTNNWKGVIRHARFFNITGLTDAQIDNLAADAAGITPAASADGHGVTNADWMDLGSEGIHHGTVYGSPDTAFLVGEHVFVNGELKNP